MKDFLYRGSLSDLDPDVYQLTRIESERQYRKLILIPSESRRAYGSARSAIFSLPKYLFRGLSGRKYSLDD